MTFLLVKGEHASRSCGPHRSFATIRANNTRQGYARKRILKPAGYFFVRGIS